MSKCDASSGDTNTKCGAQTCTDKQYCKIDHLDPTNDGKKKCETCS